MSPTWRDHIRTTLESCRQLIQRIQGRLDCDSSLILHRSKWRCLARSYSLVLHALAPHACPMLGSSEQDTLSHKVNKPLDALYDVMQEGEKCLEDCIRGSSDDHMWLVNKALMLGISTDVVDLHLHDLVWCYFVLQQALRGANLTSTELLAQMRRLNEVWADHEGAGDDLSSALEFLDRVKAEEEGDISSVADFIRHKLYSASDLESVASNDDLPAYLWVDPEKLKIKPNAIGQGGFAKVYETEWLGGRFAVKDFFYVKDAIEFGREAAIQARLRHPNVIHLVCCTKNTNMKKCSLVMELMQKDLKVLMMDRQERGSNPPFSLLAAVDLMLQIAKGMKYLHNDLRTIHRDLKSSNILVSFRTGQSDDSYIEQMGSHVHLKIADFGMSKAKHASSKFTSKMKGTTPWRAPEVFNIDPEDEVEAAGPNARYTKKADVYSFGLVCYEILTGESPFEGYLMGQIGKKVMEGERPKLPSYCPRALAGYIERCWHGEPSVRPTFTQICRMLRYFKACILLGNHHDPAAGEAQCLSRALSSGVCSRIDDMIKSISEEAGVFLHPHPLSIPLEMYCCRTVLLQEGDGSESSSGHGTLSTGHGPVGEISLSTREGDGAESSSGLGTPSTGHDPVGEISSITREGDGAESRSGHGTPSTGHEPVGEISSTRRATSSNAKNGTPPWKAKGCFTAIPRKIKGLFRKLRSGNATLQSDLGLATRSFTFKELALATRNFSTVIGQGGFWKVYKGELIDGRAIAVKAPTSLKLLSGGRGMRSHQGSYYQLELDEQLKILRNLRHRNLVPMLGWCQVEGQLILVYEFMPNGDLEAHILTIESRENAMAPVLAWELRYRVVSQVASALKYLQQDCGQQIVHRDVKPSHVFLDSEWNARLGEYGLSVVGVGVGGDGSYTPAGTFGGYTAPECFLTGMAAVTPAVDVYSFGITVLVIACGKHPNEIGSVDAGRNLREWVWGLYQADELMEAADARLRGVFDEAQMRRLLLLGLSCSNMDPHSRPTIDEVLTILSGASEPLPPQGGDGKAIYIYNTSGPHLSPTSYQSSRSSFFQSFLSLPACNEERLGKPPNNK